MDIKLKHQISRVAAILSLLGLLIFWMVILTGTYDFLNWN